MHLILLTKQIQIHLGKYVVHTVSITQLYYPPKKHIGNYWNAHYTLITDLSPTNTTLPIIQCILQYISFITVHSGAAVIGCLGDVGLLRDKAAMFEVT